MAGAGSRPRTQTPPDQRQIGRPGPETDAGLHPAGPATLWATRDHIIRSRDLSRACSGAVRTDPINVGTQATGGVRGRAPAQIGRAALHMQLADSAHRHVRPGSGDQQGRSRCRARWVARAAGGSVASSGSLGCKHSAFKTDVGSCLPTSH
jgi:hypothetical protein